MKKKKDKQGARKPRLGAIVSFVIYMLIGVVDGFAVGEYLYPFYGDGEIPLHIMFIALFVPLIIFLYAHTLLHEWGHFIFGRLSGYSLISFRIGSHIFLRQNDKIVGKKFKMAGTGGQCLMLPPEGEEIPHMLFNLGGVIVNTVFSAIAGAAAFFLPEGNLVRFLLMVFAAVGVGTALTNGIPMKVGGIVNDGYNAVMAQKDSLARSLFRRQLLIVNALTYGTRLKDMPDEWLELPENANLADPPVCAFKAFAFSREMDRLNFERARLMGEELLSNGKGLLPIHRNGTLCEMLFLELIGECRKEEIDRLYTKDLKNCIRAMKNTPSIKRLMYTYELLANDNPDAAHKEREAFERCAARHPYPCEIENERELLAAADNAAEIRAAAQAAL